MGSIPLSLTNEEMKMKAIHNVDNWKKMTMREGRGEHFAGLVYRDAPVDRGGQVYPPIDWSTICRAHATARPVAQLPQIWLDQHNDRVLGVIWEICARYEMGEYDDLDSDAIRALVCEVHQHLGSLYAQFVIH